ncbi:hypothetical protein SAMN02927924_04514 [Sphingobium faniae]|nr:hypothetical protein SAMN02927924_04514 [Sphingobium faniae]
MTYALASKVSLSIVGLTTGGIGVPCHRQSCKTAMRALAQRWLKPHEEIQTHDKVLEQLVAARASRQLAAHEIATTAAAEALILVGDDPTRIRSETALAKLCGVCTRSPRSAARPTVSGSIVAETDKPALSTTSS